jgi:hypothetical protein
LQDAFSSNRSNTSAITVTAGTFDANSYNLTLSGAASGVSTSGASVRTIAIGSGTLTIAGTGGWSAATATNLTVTGTGTISLTSASSKTFAGGGVQTYPTVNQGGAGILTFTGSNKFTNITNTYSATGATTVRFTANTTNDFGVFNLTGESGRVCTLASTSSIQAILRKSSAWNVGANSTNVTNNTGLSFTAGGGIDFLAISNIRGVFSVTYAAFVVEAAAALDSLGAGLSYNVQFADSVTALDEMLGRYLWNPIDDSQTPNWQNVGSAQTPTWTDINDSQTPGWTPINS